MRRYDYVLFDLDGTLVESAPGVRLSLESALEQLSLPCPDLSDYSLYVGPPLEETFRGLCAVPEELIEKAMSLYRKNYNEIAPQTNRLYDGVTKLLEGLQKNGARLAICTSKNEPVAEDVAELLGLSRYLDAVCGSNLEGTRRAKADIIPYALETLGCADKARAVMVGDTHFDARGAQLAGVDFIGVTYGYGTKESMERFGVSAFADSAGEVSGFIL